MALDLSTYESKVKPVQKGNEKSAFNKLTTLLNKDIKLFDSGINDKKKERFFSDLHMLLSSGIDFKSAFELIAEEQKKKSDKELFEKLKNDITNGSSLSEAMQSTGKFNQYEYFNIKIGEGTGRLSQVLEELAKYYEGKIAQKRQFVSTLTYPSVVLLMAVGITFFMLKVVVPNFADLFKRFNSDLPFLTRIVMKASRVFSSYFGITTLILIAVVTLIYINRKKTWFRKFSSGLLLKIPVVNKLITNMYLVRFCHSMNLLISAQTPLTIAIEMVGKMIGFYPIEQALIKIKEDIERGKSLHESMKAFPVFNSRMISLIKVAEEVNKMDVIFKRLSDQYVEEVSHQTKVLNNLIEPLMMLFIGTFVLLILIALYMPMFQLGNAIK